MAEALSLENAEFQANFEELKFWLAHKNQIFLCGIIPSEFPENDTVKQILGTFKTERDFYAILERIKELENWFWNSPVLTVVR